MRIGSENIPLVIGQPASDLKVLGPTDQGDFALQIVCDGKRITILATPEESEALGLALIKGATIAHLKRRNATASSGVAKPA